MSHITPKVPHSGSSRETEILPSESHSTLLTAYKWGSSYAKLGSVEIGALLRVTQDFRIEAFNSYRIGTFWQYPQSLRRDPARSPKMARKWALQCNSNSSVQILAIVCGTTVGRCVA